MTQEACRTMRLWQRLQCIIKVETASAGWHRGQVLCCSSASSQGHHGALRARCHQAALTDCSVHWRPTLPALEEDLCS